MSLKSIRSDLLVRHAVVTLARYLDRLGINGTIHSHALVLDDRASGIAESAVCYFAVKSVGYDDFDHHTTAMAVVLSANAIRTGAVNSAVYHESECHEFLDCPREIIEALTPTRCPRAKLWRLRCLSMRFAEQYRELAS